MKKPKLALVRGRFLNPFEGQNYNFKKIKVVGFSSLKPINDQVSFPVIKLASISDLQSLSFLDKPIKFIANRTLGDSQILFGLEKYANQFDFWQTADSHYYYSYQLAKLRARKKIKKLIITSWETIPFNNQATRAKNRIKFFSQKQADLFLTYTNRARQALIKEGINQSKIKTIYLGVNLRQFKPIFNKNKKTINLLFVGRLVEEKGILDLYSVFKQLIKKKLKTSIRLSVIGQGPLEKRLKQKITIDGLRKLITIEKKSYKQMPEVYQKADIFIGPSKTTSTWEEQYGMVFIEAMACGLPIISYKSGAISEIVNSAGILVKESSQVDLFKSVINLIKNQDLRLKLGKISRERAEKFFDSKKQAKELEEFYYQHLF